MNTYNEHEWSTDHAQVFSSEQHFQPCKLDTGHRLPHLVGSVTQILKRHCNLTKMNEIGCLDHMCNEQ